MAVHPTRFMNRNTPIDMMTLDQLERIHGPNPVKKHIPERPFGPPRSREDLQGQQDQQRLYPQAAQAPTAGPAANAVPVQSTVTAVPQNPTNGKPKARLKPLAVSPTDPNHAGPWQTPVCRDTMELEIEVENLGIVLYPIECEIRGEHPNQPHMARVPGESVNPTRPPQDVFVGWADVPR